MNIYDKFINHINACHRTRITAGKTAPGITCHCHSDAVTGEDIDNVLCYSADSVPSVFPVYRR